MIWWILVEFVMALERALHLMEHAASELPLAKELLIASDSAATMVL
jgi:hypothetical protein